MVLWLNLESWEQGFSDGQMPAAPTGAQKRYAGGVTLGTWTRLLVLSFPLKMKVLVVSPGVPAALSRGDGAPPSHGPRPVHVLHLAHAQSLPCVGCLRSYSYAFWDYYPPAG